MNKYFNFNTTYTALPDSMYSYVDPTKVTKPSLFLYNEKLANQIGVLHQTSASDIANILSGNILIENSKPIAQAYYGHQFGYLNELGDGRAILLGEHITKNNKRYDIQLKGAGKTPYARSADGRATLASMIREYLISEAMHHLNIKTTRSLAVIKTGETVRREVKHQGAVLTRMASSHIRVGTFQFAALQQDKTILKKLADYTINRHYPKIKTKDNLYLELFKAIMQAQISLIVDWMRVGFVHGVMNTDNILVSGETIDYGPCAFMDTYNLGTVFSSIDIYGRYSYGNQVPIMAWNMARLAEAFVPLISKRDDESGDKEALAVLNAELSHFLKDYNAKYLKVVANKIGFAYLEDDDEEFISVLLNFMQLFGFDYTNTFVYLRTLIKPLNIDADLLIPNDLQARQVFKTWCDEWFDRLEKKSLSTEQVLQLMESLNPIYIPRNLIVEEAIKMAECDDTSKLESLLEKLSKPYDYKKADIKYVLASQYDKGFITYCGT